MPTFASIRFAALAFSVAALASPLASAQVVIDRVTVGNPGNAADTAVMSDGTTGYGAVAYEYRIGTYEVTNAQYAAFLNAVAASDVNGLYSANMGTNPRGGITRSGSDGSFTYSVRPNMGNKPVNFVSWPDAARFCNWLTNGQPTGLQSDLTTETGVYRLFGSFVVAITRDLNNPNQVFLPTEDEWYKAAFHQPASQGGDADDYWLYATRSNSMPGFASATSIGDVAIPGQNVVNYSSGADWNGQNGNVTTVGSAGSTSFYGAFDMNGNVFEWNETLISDTLRGYRGGSWSFTLGDFLPSSFRGQHFPSTEGSNLGFRLASPVPTTPPCPADLTGEGDVNINDFFLFLSLYQAMDPRADFAPGGGINTNDFFAFLAAYQAGC